MIKTPFPCPRSADELVDGAAATLVEHGPMRLKEFDRFPAPLYATDESGMVVYFNPACASFAGRVPRLGVDKWCISWKLRTGEGAPLAHHNCPMAVAIRDARPVRGTEAFAERPDGQRRRFRPYPTPAVDKHGRLVGAVNLLVPTDGETCRDLLTTAAKCRRLAQWVDDKAASATLTHMAIECEIQAAVLRID